MFLNYFSLFILLAGLVGVFYTFIYIHDLPYNAAKRRNHPQQEAIHIACWLSLFTLHAIWPIVYIWAVSKQGPSEVSVEGEKSGDNHTLNRLTQLENRLMQLEESSKPSKKASGVL